MVKLELNGLAHFLRMARWPVLPKRQPTFFTIAGIAHKELPLSNTYGFFFCSEEAHGLGALFVQALLDVVREKANGLVNNWPEPVGPVWVSREHPMRKGQWLDLLVHDGAAKRSLAGSSFAILLENKVYHRVANDLANYWDSVQGPGRKLGVVLGIRREQEVANWLFVTHWELAAAIQVRLGPLLAYANPRYLPLLLQLLEHMTYMKNSMHDNFALAFDFAQQYRQELAQAQQVLAELRGQALGEAVVTALGEGFEQQVSFDDRVDVRLTQPAPFRYIVFYSHILDLSKPPGFSITLYAAGANKPQTGVWRDYLEAQAWVQQIGAAKLPWFGFDSLVIGKEYAFTGNSLADFMDAVRIAWQDEWQPLEAAWVGLSEPPVLPY